MTPRVGGEFQFSRWSVGGLGGFDVEADASITQFAPLILFRLGEPPAADDVMLRPYVGGGLNFFRSTATVSIGGIFDDEFSETQSDTATGIQMLGGVEIAFQDAPRFVLSGDIGYHSTGKLFGGLSVGGMAFSVSAHWYFK
jgi:hypothetical protein